MASENGQIVYCDRCGRNTFRKAIGEGEADGGFTRWNKFEPLAEGWMNQNIGDGWLMLCPECANQFIEIMKQFVHDKKDFIK